MTGTSHKGRLDRGFRETIGWHARLTDPKRNFLRSGSRKLSSTYASAELLWYLSGSNTLEAVTPYAPSYDRFAEPDGTAYGAYGYRIKTWNGVNGNRDAVQVALDTMSCHDNSRQVVVALWRPDDLWHAHALDKKDLPCTLTWQFFKRDDQLHMHVNMRSNDVWLGLPYDVYVNTSIQRLVAAELGLRLGSYVHTVGSLHLYDQNLARAYDVLDEYTSSPQATLDHGWQHEDLYTNAQYAVRLEQHMRIGALTNRDDLQYDIELAGLSRSLFSDSLACLSCKWLAEPDIAFSPALQGQ